ncbi:SDR family oxidoreductase [Nonomuraea roseoviolacea subsp. roseoviolacea]|uniref:3-oxoacyl-[acyl-carrier protein] reductase n=1 Tax=Nonomuraea roseoviolacea subsp. carminata TaxID=160689 RepID=A0ABT1KAE5_9ACTN|nr:SDR family oxidoreductase [Nonomuraea roseoviolacea]MCP2350970.1 3-oxoacyl-[acyl-carrier protein] reductase [Nonomuraea roseoviolacea subsp. carminata]
MGRTVLVTGGTSGIGRAVAARFAADGADVVITGRHPDTVEPAAKELGVRGLACDAARPDQVAALAEELGGPLGVLVNAAGGLPAGPAAGTPPLEALAQEWLSSVSANVLTAVLTTTAVSDLLVPGGTVVSIGSIGAERGGGSYGAAKAALAAWNATLAAALGPRDVTCNVISSGYVTGTNFFGDGMTEERHRRLVEETLLKRPGTPGDIAETVFFLASPGARHITGQTIHVNGGAFTTR